MKNRRWAALALCLLLVFLTAAPSAGASESVYSVVLGNEVLPLSDETMPFWSGGYLYIAAFTFGSAARKNVGVSYTGSSERAILYSGGDRSLIFDLEKSNAQDSAGNVSVWLGERVSGPGLRAFLNAAGDADRRCLALTETS